MTNYHCDGYLQKKLPNNSEFFYWCSRSFKKYNCWKCNFKTDFLAELKTHYKAGHESQRSHFVQLCVCNDCGLQTLSILLFLLHKKSNKCATKNRTSLEHSVVDNTIYFQCEHCSFKTETKVLLEQHNLKKHSYPVEVASFNCEQCIYKTKREHLLQRNQKEKHTVEKPKLRKYNKCVIKERVPLQQLMDNNIKYLQCEHCSFKTETNTLLEQHNLEQHSPVEEVTPFNCELCSYKTKREHLLKRHLTTNHAGESKKFQCGRCGLQFTPKDDFTQLTNKHDTREKNQQFTCEQCTLKTSKKHIDGHLGNDEIMSEQPFTTKQKRDLEQHLALKYSQVVKIHCEHCASTFKRKDHLQRHLMTQHVEADKIQWFYCERCPYKAKRKDTLKQHTIGKHTIGKHTKVDMNQWFYCEHCPYNSKRKDHLGRHTLVKHREVDINWWFYCEHCPYKNKRKYRLNQHTIEKHRKLETVRWFHCEHCVYKSKRKYLLKQHTITKH